MTTPHVLVVTADGPAIRYAVECPGVTEQCQLWGECTDCTPADDAALAAVAEAGERFSAAHGVDHQRFADWCIPTGLCFVATHYDLDDVARDAGFTEPGRYDVGYEIEDESWLSLYEVTGHG